MNIMQLGKMAVTHLLHASPVISAGCAVVGAVVLFVCTVKDTERAKEEVFDELNEREEPLSDSEKKTVVVKLAKIYARSLVCLALVIGSVLFTTCTFSKRLKNLSVCYNSLAAYTTACHTKMREYENTHGIEQKYEPLPFAEVPAKSTDEEGVLCLLTGYSQYFTVPCPDDIYKALDRASNYISDGWSVRLCDLLEWMGATVYDNSHSIELGPLLSVNLGWTSETLLNYYVELDRFDLQTCVYTQTDDSGLNVTFIDIPAPQVLF